MECQSVKKTHMMWPVVWHAKLTLHAHRFASDSIERVPVAVVMVYGGGTHHRLQALPLLLRRVSRCSSHHITGNHFDRFRTGLCGVMVLNRCATDYTPIYTSVTLVLNWFGSKPVEHRLTNRC